MSEDVGRQIAALMEAIEQDHPPITYEELEGGTSTTVVPIESSRSRRSSTLVASIGVAAAVALAVAGLVVLGGSDELEQPVTTGPVPPETLPAPPPSTSPRSVPSSAPLEIDPAVTAALDVASRFMDGFARRDISVIEETAVEGQVRGLLVGNFDTLQTEFAWLDAIGWTMTVDACVVDRPDPERTTVTCFVVIDNAWSRALGTGPYDAEFYISLTPPGGEYGVEGPFDRWTVTERLSSEQFPRTAFELETWDPFVEWVDANHPSDFTTMVLPGMASDLHLFPAFPALTDESVELWRRHTDEFVREQTSSPTS